MSTAASLSPDLIGGHFLRGFEVYLNRIGCRTLGALSPPVLSAFITESAGSFGRTAMIGLCSTLRVFLRYLRREGMIARDLAHCVEPPQVYRLADLPRSISWDEVRRMLDAVERRTPVGRRDYANGTWTDLFSGAGLATDAPANLTVTTGIDSSTAYRFHRVNIEGNGINAIIVCQLQFFSGNDDDALP